MIYAMIFLALLIVETCYLVVHQRMYKPIGGLLISKTDEGYNIGVGLYTGYYIEDALAKKYVVLEVDTNFNFLDSHENQTL